MKMRYEVGEYLPFSRELKLYLMKCAAFCDANLEQYQVAHNFYTKTDIRPFSAFETHRGNAQT